MADSHHLFQRGGIWHYRRRVPRHAIDLVGSKVVQHSLSTRSIKEARKLRNALDVRYDALFEKSVQSGKRPAAKAVTMNNFSDIKLTWEDVNKRISEYLASKFERFERNYLNDPADSIPEIYAIKIDLAQEIEALTDPENPNTQAMVSGVFDELFPSANFDGVSDAGAAELVRRGLTALIRQKAAFLSDDTASTMSVATPKQRKLTSFGDVARDYLDREAERAGLNRRKPQWIAKITAHVGFLIEFVGSSTPIETVDYDFVVRLQSVLSRLPANRNKIFPNVSIDRAINLAAQLGKPSLKPLSQSRYLDFFKGILDLAVAKRIIPNNPASNMRPLMEEKLAASDKRRPFAPHQIALFFSSAFYRKWPIDAKSTYTAKDRDWRFWLPLLAAYTGMRPGEICQLETTDVRCSASGVWYLHIVPTDDDDQEKLGPVKSLKTEFSRRSFPLHPDLIKVGFLDFHSKQKKAVVNGRLFPGLKPGRNGYYSDYPCRRFRETYLPEAMPMEPRQTFYSFRHSFRDALRRADAPNDVLSALGGWSEGTKVSDNYGDKNDPDYLFKYVSKLKYPGVTLDFHYS